jgi:hypothetical protein
MSFSLGKNPSKSMAICDTIAKQASSALEVSAAMWLLLWHLTSL